MERAARGLPALSRRGCRVSAVRGPVPPGLSLPGVPRGGAGVGRFKGSGSPRPQESGAAQPYKDMCAPRQSAVGAGRWVRVPEATHQPPLELLPAVVGA